MLSEVEQKEIERYAVIRDKNPREIVLLRGLGCVWKKCRFCDYHRDFSPDERANFERNRQAIARVTGVYQRLEVVNSGSFFELDDRTQALIAQMVQRRGITTMHFESHWIFRENIEPLREKYAAMGVTLKAKIGVETFRTEFRERHLQKGLTESDPGVIARYFDECCLLFGLEGQTEASMGGDIETALEHFERVCINIMCKNTTAIQPDARVIRVFQERLLPLYRENPRVDILLHNEDFGVGGSA